MAWYKNPAKVSQARLVHPGGGSLIQAPLGGESLRTLGYGTQPGNAAACFTHVAICASSSWSPSWMSM